MQIQRLIRDLFQDSDAVFHNADGNPLCKEQILSEYQGIKCFLLDNMSEADIVAIRLAYDYRYLLSILVCMEIGLPYVPLRLGWPSSRCEQIKQLSGYTCSLDEGNIEAICSYGVIPERTSFPISLETPLYIIYTSGTTGEPKGVVIQRKAYEHFVRWIDDEITSGPDCKILFVADFSFDMSLLDIALFLVKQCQCFFSQFDGNFFRLAHEIETYGIHSIATVPNNISLLLQDDIFERSSFESLKQLLLGGSRFSYGTYHSIQAKLPRLEALYNFYGPTEVTVYCHFQRLTGIETDDVKDANVTIGKTAPGLKCLLRDPSERTIDQPNTAGELLVGGIQVMREYLGDPMRSSQSLTVINGDVYYRTGDIAYFDDSGRYYITGRKDETLKRRGYRINLADIDSYIQKLDFVCESATVAIPDSAVDHLLVTYLVARQQFPESVVRQKLSHFLVDYQIPDYILYTDSFPTNNSGKICKESLKKMFAMRTRVAA
jgi:acyl-coenzyme A synthetase/AMP-(fatty) acid ligase